jgi:hypothetical protein
MSSKHAGHAIYYTEPMTSDGDAAEDTSGRGQE